MLPNNVTNECNKKKTGELDIYQFLLTLLFLYYASGK